MTETGHRRKQITDTTHTRGGQSCCDILLEYVSQTGHETLPYSFLRSRHRPNASNIQTILPECVRVVCRLTPQRRVLFGLICGRFLSEELNQDPTSILTLVAVFLLHGAPLRPDSVSPRVKATEDALIGVQLLYHGAVAAHTLRDLRSWANTNV